MTKYNFGLLAALTFLVSKGFHVEHLADEAPGFPEIVFEVAMGAHRVAPRSGFLSATS